jgi:Raf kinase inhibitor-like YbhB/YbcL family protein
MQYNGVGLASDLLQLGTGLGMERGKAMGTPLRCAGLMLMILVALAACGRVQPEGQVQEAAQVSLQLESSAFKAGETIPARYTCDGDDVSPPLSWADPPPGTESFTLIVDDPDAPVGTWDHWVLFSIAAAVRSLPENVPPDAVVDGVGVHGANSWRNLGYGGPCPPQGPAHRYFLRLYALDTVLDLKAGASRGDVERAMQGHILAESELIGQYGR